MAKATRATRAFKAAQIPFDIMEYDFDKDVPSIGLHAAASLGVPPQIMFKTLMLVIDGKPYCAIVPSDQELSMKRVAAAFGGKSATMMKRDDAQRCTGYKIGGISPLGQARAIPTVMDESALAHPEIYINGGQRGLQIKMSPRDLATLLVAKVAAITA